MMRLSGEFGGVDFASDSSGVECDLSVSGLEVIQSFGKLQAVIMAVLKVTQ